MYLDSPKFNVAGVFNPDTTIHAYKGTSVANACLSNYDNVDLYKIKINYYLDGGEISETAPEYIYYRNKVVIPEPTKEGYQFTGWYVNENMTETGLPTPYYNKVAEDDPEELNYYAGWMLVNKVETEEVTELDNGNYENTDVSPAEIEVEETTAKAEETAKEQAKEQSDATAKANTVNSEANKSLLKDGVTASEQEEIAPGTATFTFKQMKGKKIRIKVSQADADGYEVQYSAHKKFKKSKTLNKLITTTSDTKYIKGLTRNKKYYVRARAYSFAADGTKLYGEWTKTKTVKIKK